METVKIRRELLGYLLELAREFYPNEFAGFLREKAGVFEEVLIAPDPHFGRSSAFFNTWMLPYDESIKGTVHSHPGPNPWPSQVDLNFFSKFGGVHLIIAYPFTEDSVRAYKSDGSRLKVEILD
ncbi:metalloprotease [Thermococcus sp. GR7]|uniref:Mov34/MPN/PAD-1 family protein n=1 Tax=unclassified Thermococcus TaxID=2627626 RepID=UPI00142FCC61|nr:MULTISPECIES: Mov34/MPN/PAD-1 family protein [unclassified Thermococcus]NJE46513.1 metalloprotease [Thermococcus sp. GR7]NJE77567.1 metalloprotease [Thermococcus sp. GR4]NJF23656.1 metalloprotease [Thermococcus sp. GR5]